MTTSLSANKYNRKNWEASDFPILCETCLGENPYVRMTKDKYGAECKICMRPFTVFRWCPGQGMRYKRTDICQTCAKLKNVCQTCIFDLEFGVPVQLRDKVLADAAAKSITQPKSELNREYFMQHLGDKANDVQKLLSNPEGKGLGSAQVEAAKEKLKKLGRQGPYYKRNAPKICTFYLKGMCKRGEECPYRHEKPTDPDDPLSQQNRRDRYFGTNDPVADKLWARIEKMPDRLKAPADQTITTLFIKGVTSNVTDKDLNAYFYQFGQIHSISIIEKKNIAFVQFLQRQDAERAMTEIHGHDIMVAGQNLEVRWGRNRTKKLDGTEGPEYETVPGLPGKLPGIEEAAEMASGSRAAPDLSKGVAIAPPVELTQGNSLTSSSKGIEQADGLVAIGNTKQNSILAKKLARKRIGGKLESVSSTKKPNEGKGAKGKEVLPTAVHYPSQNPDRMGGYM